MATTISTQDIIDAKRDIDDIGKAVNENTIVSPRYGEDFKSLPMISAEFQISSDAAEAAAVSAAESANIAQSSANIAEAAATAAAISANIFETPEAGVDPVTGVADGAYFNVRSSSDDSYIDEYQNVGGVPTPTGKTYPSAAALTGVKEAIIDPITGKASASKVFDDSGKSMQALSDSYHKYIANVLNFGAKTIPGFDNRDAFEAAGAWLEAKGGGALYIPDGVFEFYSVFGSNNCCIKPRANVTYVGNFGRRSCLKFGDGLNLDKSYGCTFIFPPESSDTTPIDNIKVRGICFDHNGSNNIMVQPPSSYPFTTGGQALGVLYGDNITYEHNVNLNNAGRQTVMIGKNAAIPTIDKSTVRFNTFINCGKSVTGNSSQTDHSSIYSLCKDSDVYGNLFFNQVKDTVSTAIELHGTKPKAWGNNIYNYGQAFNLAATVANMNLGVFRDNYVEGCAHIGTLWGFAGLSLSTLIKGNTFVIDIANQAQINGITNIQSGVIKNSHTVEDNRIIYSGGYADADYSSFIDVAYLTRLYFGGNKFPEGYSGRAVNISSVKANSIIILKGNDLTRVAGTSRAGYEECFWINSGLTTNIKQLIITDNTAIDCDKYLYTIPNVAATVDNLVERNNVISKSMTDVGSVGAAVVLGSRSAIIDRVTNRINARASQGSRVFDTSTGKRYIKATNDETSTGWVEEFNSIAVGSGTWVNSSIPSGGTRTTNIMVSNPITPTSVINFSFGAPLQGTIISAEYQDSTTVKLTQYNPTAGSLNFAVAPVTVRVSG